MQIKASSEKQERMSSQVKSSQVKSSQVKSNQVKEEIKWVEWSGLVRVDNWFISFINQEPRGEPPESPSGSDRSIDSST